MVTVVGGSGMGASPRGGGARGAAVHVQVCARCAQVPRGRWRCSAENGRCLNHASVTDACKGNVAAK